MAYAHSPRAGNRTVYRLPPDSFVQSYAQQITLVHIIVELGVLTDEGR